MVRTSTIALLAVLSFGALADVSFEEKKNRVEYLEELSKSANSMNIEAYRRELRYEELGLDLSDRAKNEANLLAETVKSQVVLAYEASLSEHGNEQTAYEEVKNSIEKDLEIAAPELREELRSLSMNALNNIQKGEVHSETNLAQVENVLLKGVKERSEYLNAEAHEEEELISMMYSNPPTVNKSRDSEKAEYKSKAEILGSLVSDRESTRWVSTSNLMLKSAVIKKIDSKISLQVKIEFLGATLEAGPSIMFKREYNTTANIMAEGLNPVIRPDGNFDMFKRNMANQIIKENGKSVKRFVAFYCDGSLEFETDYAGGGGFSYAGIGGGASVSKKFSNSVQLVSRRILVPQFIDNKTATFKYLTELCHKDFLNARITNNLTVTHSLNMMMKSVVASLRFSHPKSQCAIDKNCLNWYKKDVLPMAKIGHVPRCVENGGESFRVCELRTMKNGNCSIFKENKRITRGVLEYPCDAGLKCVQTETEGWLKGGEFYHYAVGKCLPINPKTYVDPRYRK